MLTTTTTVIRYTYDPLQRLTSATYSDGKSFQYQYDAVGNRTAMTSTMPLSGTVATTYVYDAANRLTNRTVSDGRVYTYTWSARGEMLAEWTHGYAVRTFSYDDAGQMVKATVFTLTTRFRYDGDGARRVVEVVGRGATTYALDYAADDRVLAEGTITGTTLYLYGRDCLGEFANNEWLYYLPDANGYVRQGTDEQGKLVSHWLYDPDGTVLEGPEGPVSHLVCGGIYDWSTGLIYKNGRYFDPTLGIWLALTPLLVIQSRRGRKRKRQRFPWYVVLLLIVCVGGLLAACGGEPGRRPMPVCTEVPFLSFYSIQTYGTDDIGEWPASSHTKLGFKRGASFRAEISHITDQMINRPGDTPAVYIRQYTLSHRAAKLDNGTWYYNGSADWLFDWAPGVSGHDLASTSPDYFTPEDAGQGRHVYDGRSDAPYVNPYELVHPSNVSDKYIHLPTGSKAEVVEVDYEDKFQSFVVVDDPQCPWTQHPFPTPTPLGRLEPLGMLEWSWHMKAELIDGHWIFPHRHVSDPVVWSQGTPVPPLFEAPKAWDVEWTTKKPW